MPSHNIKVTAFSSALTKEIGRVCAALISRKMSLGEEATVIKLAGNLGAGKTTFVLGFLSYFGIKPQAASPTFVIMKHYIPKVQFKTQRLKVKGLYHLDAYRLHSRKDLEVLGFDKILRIPGNLVLIEWPERIKGLHLKNSITLRFGYGAKENERVIHFPTIN